MLFNFQSFIEDMRDKEEKKEIIEKYEKFFGKISSEIKEQQRFREYVINFKSVNFLTPEELKSEFDWNLLLQLVASSFSSECYLDKITLENWEPKTTEDNQKIYDLTISVKSWDQSVVKKVSELWSFQVIRLYEIYIEEQMNLQILIKEDENESQAIISQRQARIQRRKLVLDTLDKEEVEKIAKQEQEQKLGDLYSQL